jgi:hypothetical protein
MKHELRIGNKVMLNGEIITVKSIEFNPVTGNHFIRIEEDFRQIITDFLEPIPLTEELLVKCGGVKLEHKMFPCYNVDGIQLILRGGWFEYVHDIHIKSLHQFQNFYFFTRQQELTIEM